MAERFPDPSAAPPTCRCGHDLNHFFVTPEPSYGFWAWVLLLNGATGTPREIAYRCQRCREVLHVTRDRDVLRSYR